MGIGGLSVTRLGGNVVIRWTFCDGDRWTLCGGNKVEFL